MEGRLYREDVEVNSERLVVYWDRTVESEQKVVERSRRTRQRRERTSGNKASAFNAPKRTTKRETEVLQSGSNLESGRRL